MPPLLAVVRLPTVSAAPSARRGHCGFVGSHDATTAFSGAVGVARRRLSAMGAIGLPMTFSLMTAAAIPGAALAADRADDRLEERRPPASQHMGDPAIDAIDVRGRPVRLAALARNPLAETATLAAPSRIRAVSVEITRPDWNRIASLAAPQGREAAADLNPVALQMRYGTRRTSFTIGLGALDYRIRPDAGPLASGSQRSGTLPMVSIGYHHQFGQRLSMQADAFGAMSPLGPSASPGALSGPNGSEIYGAKLRMEWTPVRDTGLGFEHGAFNMKLNSGTNMALRIRKGGPMLYMRAKF